jgi:site-specific DNA-methyltransferase (cytosine-N4-specific)
MVKPKISYRTKLGFCINDKIENFITSNMFSKYENNISLIFTSPPFPLKRKKKYGNYSGAEYVDWLTDISVKLEKLLTPTGSLVIELGNAWEPKYPIMSLLPLKTLLSILEKNNLYLCQSFIWYNSAKLPTPAQWVNVERIRVKDSYTNIWWMSKTPKPKANNKNVLNEYSDSMKKLLVNHKYNSGWRPSEHIIGEKSFFKNNSGSIPSNVLIGANTQSSSKYLSYCKENKLELHPARMPEFIPEFFIKFLTNQEDIVLDPFAGSNVTGYTAEKLQRKWISVEANINYVKGSKGRFK